MQIIAVVPLILAFVGLVLWFAMTNAKVQEVGRLLFFAGILAFCLSMTGTHVRIG